MEKLIYTKYSNQRNARFAIRTDIYQQEDGTRTVRKYADTDAAKAHIEHIKSVYDQMLVQFAGSRLKANHAELADGCVILEYVEGDTLEKQLDACLMENDREKFASLVREYADEIRRVYEKDTNGSTGASLETGTFQEVFGDVTLPVSVKMAKGVDIDLIFSNIIVQKDVWTVIDYEWTFDFEVPVEFVLWRAGKVYLENYGNRAEIQEEDMNRMLGVTQENATAYRQMEMHFLQQYCYKGQSDLYELFGTMGQTIASVNPEDVVANSEQGINLVQVYYDTGNGMSEEESDKLHIYPNEQGEYHLKLRLPEHLQALRIDPGENPCILHMWKACAYTSAETYACTYIINGYRVAEEEYAVDHEDPQIHITNLKPGTQNVELHYTINADPAALLGLQRKIKNAKRLQKIKGMIR